MKFTTRLLIYLVPLAIIDTIIPVPITCLLLIYIVLERPPWFQEYVKQVYEG
jgi:hypothetical protein